MVQFVSLEELGKAFVPERFQSNLRYYFLKAGIYQQPYRYFGMLFFVTFALTAVLYIGVIFPFLSSAVWWLLLLGSAGSFFAVMILLVIITSMIIYFYLDVRIYRRTKQMELALPEFLQVLSSNIKGGMSFENALMHSIKPRFKILANEMAEVSKKVMTGYDVGMALHEFGQKYDSMMLRRSIDLMISEIESGGQITTIIDKIVLNLKEARLLKEEISASAVSYTIFISIIVIVLSPLLFALSFNLLIIILGFVGRLAQTTSRVQNLPISFTDVTLNPDDFQTFSIVALTVVAFFSSIIVSIVEKGDIKGGLKFIPLFTLGSLFFYFLFMRIFSLLFSGILA